MFRLLAIPLSLICLAQVGSCQKYPYGEVLQKSILFYEAQRSGYLPEDNRIDWRGDSALDDFIVGGYYDAGDHVKFGFPMAFITTQLAWGGVQFKAGYDAAGETDNFKKTLMWATDYMIAAHVGPKEFVGQIGAGDADHAFWGRPEDMTMDRPDFRITESAPGSDLAGETAAALAAASMFYDLVGDSESANDALSHARELFTFADENRGKYSDSIPDAANFYYSWAYEDELFWSAAWMYKATGESEYLSKAEQFYDEFGFGYFVPDGFGWDNKHIGALVLMYEATSDPKYESDIIDFIDVLKNQIYTPQGLIFIGEWGSCRSAASVAHICMAVADLGIEEQWCNDFAETQMNYILGDTGRSYVVGWGTNPPTRPHHRASSCEDMPAPCDASDFDNPGPNPQVLEGALVGGPDVNDEYVDDRGDYVHNEVATDYNSGFQSALAALAAKYAK